MEFRAKKSTAKPVVHMAGPVRETEGKRVQLCRWCYKVLATEHRDRWGQIVSVVGVFQEGALIRERSVASFKLKNPNGPPDPFCYQDPATDRNLWGHLME